MDPREGHSGLPRGDGETSVRRRWRLLLAVVALVAFSARLWPVVHGGGLFGLLGYDDGVYYAAADAVVAGRMPYRDFLFLHPPGVILFLVPFAAMGWVTADPAGFVAARLAFIAAGAGNAVLVSLILRRFGWAAAMSGGMFYALWVRSVAAQTTISLGALVDLGVLIALFLILTSREKRRLPRATLWFAGGSLGLASSAKMWAAVPLLVIVVWQARRQGWSSAAHVLLGSGAALVATCLPFFLIAPGEMFRMVVSDQLQRSAHEEDALVDRIVSLTSVEAVQPALGAAAAGVLLVLVLLSAAVAVGAAWRRDEARIFVVLLAACATLLLFTPSYFRHYGSFVTPGAALTFGVATGAAASLVRRRRRAVRIGAVATASAVGSALGLAVIMGRTGSTMPGAELARAVDGLPCVASDSPAALIQMDVLSRNFRNGCTVMVDVTGLLLDLETARHPGGPTAARRDNPLWQQAITRYLTSADASIVIRPRAIQLSRASRRIIENRPVIADVRGYVVYGSAGAR